jgi:hypothetical protein
MPNDGTIIEPRDAGWASGRGGSSLMPTGPDAIGPLTVAALVLVPSLALAAVVSLPVKLTIPAAGGLALALFIPVLCVLSVVMKHNKSV